jgi:tetratricopeptide (TPR) repeat protein
LNRITNNYSSDLLLALETAYDSPEATQGGQKPVIINWQNMMGTVLKELGRFADAEEYFKKSIELGDNQAEQYLTELKELEHSFEAADNATGSKADEHHNVDDNDEFEEGRVQELDDEEKFENKEAMA